MRLLIKKKYPENYGASNVPTSQRNLDHLKETVIKSLMSERRLSSLFNFRNFDPFSRIYSNRRRPSRESNQLSSLSCFGKLNETSNFNVWVI